MSEFAESLFQLGFWEAMGFFHLQNTVEILLIIVIFYGLLRFQLNEYFQAKKIQTKKASSVQKKFEQRHFWRTILVMPLIAGPPGWFMYNYGLIGFNHDTNYLAMLLQFVILIVGTDTYFYWCHRVMHRKKFYRKIHAVHHASLTPEITTAYSFDIWETFVNFSFLLWYSIGMALTVGWLHYLPIFAYMIIFHAWNVYIHSGTEYAPRWLRQSWVGRQITWATHHDLHHEKNRGNFALYFTFWDKLCGTLDPEYEKRVRS